MNSELIFKILTQVTGWSYFLFWNVSFYPQIYTNFKLKSVSGFSLDKLVYNILGYTCYTVFTCTLYWNKEVRDEYVAHLQTRQKDVPVVANDVGFAIHALLVMVTLLTQVLIYEHGQQKVNKFTWVVVTVPVLFLTGVAVASGLGHVQWYWFVMVTGYVKLGVSWIKDFPQAYLNFKRKSTHGFSIDAVCLDFTGGVLSITQQLIYSIWYKDNEELFGNIPKFCLALQSLLLDAIFYWQHYVFYQGHIPKEASKAHHFVNPSLNQEENSQLNDDAEP